jgi:hypothetical protein
MVYRLPTSPRIRPPGMTLTIWLLSASAYTKQLPATARYASIPVGCLSRTARAGTSQRRGHGVPRRPTFRSSVSTAVRAAERRRRTPRPDAAASRHREDRKPPSGFEPLTPSLRVGWRPCSGSRLVPDCRQCPPLWPLALRPLQGLALPPGCHPGSASHRAACAQTGRRCTQAPPRSQLIELPWFLSTRQVHSFPPDRTRNGFRPYCP